MELAMSVNITLTLRFEDGTEIRNSAAAGTTPPHTQEPAIPGEKIPPYGVPAQSAPRLVASPSFVRVV